MEKGRKLQNVVLSGNATLNEVLDFYQAFKEQFKTMSRLAFVFDEDGFIYLLENDPNYYLKDLDEPRPTHWPINCYDGKVLWKSNYINPAGMEIIEKIL